ncbi:MAG: PD-(D/E)XK nuclease family protein [Alistipes sp.]|nr:PD-(D/E)XK nuclease family protein [Alistipes sp.]
MQTFQRELAEALITRYHGDLSQLVVLFPSLRARTFFNDAIAQIVDRPVWQPSWTSVDEIMERGSGLVRGERIRLISELYNIYVKHHPTETFDRFYFWGDMLIADFDMIDKYLVDADLLLRNIEDIKEIESDVSYLTPEQERILSFWSSIGPKESLSEQKRRFLYVWQSLPAIYAEYKERLFELGIGYPGMIYRETAERIKRGEEISLADKHFVVAGFNALSKSEEILFKYLMTSDKGAEFYWDYDSYYVDNPDHEAGAFLRRNLSQFTPTDGISHTNFSGGQKEFNSIACASNIVQVKHVADILNKLDGELDKRMAIVLTDENLLIPLLHALPESVKSVNVTMGYPLKATLAFSFMERLIVLQSHSRQRDGRTLFYHKDVTGLLSHPYVVDCCGRRAAELASSIIGDKLTLVDAVLFNEDDILNSVFSCKTTDWKSLSKYLIDALCLIASHSNIADVTQQEYLRVLTDEIRKLKISVSKCGVDPSVEIFTSLLRKHIQTVAIPFKGEPLEGVQIMGILETRNIDFKNVVILSMTDANFPGDRTEQPSFIPYSLRIAYGLPTHEQHEAMYAYYFYRLIQRAQRVDMLYCSRADEKSTGERSRYIYQLDYESPYKVNMQSVGVDLGLAENATIEVRKGKHEMAVLNRYLDPESGYGLSPTSLFRYVECPLKFYLSTVAHIKTPDELGDKIDPLTFGNILHETMQNLYTPLIGVDNLRDRIAKLLDKELIEGAVDATICRILQGGDSGAKRDFTGDTLLVRDIIVKYIMRGILRYDLTREPFVIDSLEDEDTRCYYPISGGRTVSLSGRADRIDRLADGTLQIIDYKSGTKPHLEYNGMDGLFLGTAVERISNVFQTLLYAMMLRRSRGVSTVPSLYYASRMLAEDYSPLLKDRSTGELVERYESVAEEFESELNIVLEELFDPAVSFKQTEDEDMCLYCDYKKICRR